MDTKNQWTTQEQDLINDGLALIKTSMPMTYAAIQDKAKVPGSGAFRLVRHGLAGRTNCFYAVENGHVVGCPFDLPGVSDEVARVVVQFGLQMLIMWAPDAQQGGNHGAH
jgi:hypothetical protein